MLECTFASPPGAGTRRRSRRPSVRRPGEPLLQHCQQCNRGGVGLVEDCQVDTDQVAHGYRVLGPDPMGLVYFTTHVYNPNDELRRPWDDPAIGFNWTTVNR